MLYDYQSSISEHRKLDGIGQLILIGVVIAREGEQNYLEHEVYDNKPNSHKRVVIKRPWEVVKASMASFEGKPFVTLHPDKSIDIDVNNIDEFRVGHVQNMREGTVTENGKEIRVIIGDIVVNKVDAINSIINKEMEEVSAGYFYEIDENTNSLTEIKGEHVALVPKGRAGVSKILDADIEERDYELVELVKDKKYQVKANKGKLIDQEIIYEGPGARILATKRLINLTEGKLNDSFQFPFDTNKVAWIGAVASEVEVGNIISKIRSKRPMKIVAIEFDEEDSYHDLVFTYIDVGYEELGEAMYHVNADTQVDILIDSDSHRKIKLDSFKNYLKNPYTS